MTAYGRHVTVDNILTSDLKMCPGFVVTFDNQLTFGSTFVFDIVTVAVSTDEFNLMYRAILRVDNNPCVIRPLHHGNRCNSISSI